MLLGISVFIIIFYCHVNLHELVHRLHIIIDLCIYIYIYIYEQLMQSFINLCS